MGRPTYWTEERVREAAAGYEFISDFERSNCGAHAAIKTRYKHLKEELFPAFKKLMWTKDKLKEEAKKYNTRVDFRNGSLGAYSRAHQTNILDEVCGHMVNGRLKGNFDLGKYLQISGLYFLHNKGELVYIGKSECCVVDRIRWHYEDKVFDEIHIYPISNASDILITEAFLIGEHKPMYNIEYNTKDYPTVIIPNLSEVIGEPIVVTASFGVNGMNAHKGS